MELINKDEFRNKIDNELILVDFFATWCGPCKMLSPILDTKDIPKMKIDVDKFPDIARDFGIMSIPTLIIFKKGKEVDRHIGFLSNQELDEFIEKNK